MTTRFAFCFSQSSIWLPARPLPMRSSPGRARPTAIAAMCFISANYKLNTETNFVANLCQECADVIGPLLFPGSFLIKLGL